MNYSQRKHLERLMTGIPADPFGLRMPFRPLGLDIIESPDRPRYEMPEWLVKPTDKHDGVRWDPKFREETNRWALTHCGTENAIPPGQFIVMANRYIVGRPDDILKLSSIF